MRGKITRFLILLCLTLLSTSYLYTQQDKIFIKKGKPFSRFYHPTEYQGYSQNWYFAQNKDGLIYVANGSGLLEYDGFKWNMYRIGNQLFPTSILIVNDTIYIAGNSNIGFFLDVGNDKKYNSLINLLPENERTFPKINKILNDKNGLYFVSDDRFIFYDRKTAKSVKYGFYSNLHLIDNKVILSDYNQGFFTIEKEKVKSKISGSDFFIKKQVISIIDLEGDKIIIITRKDGMFLASMDLKNNVFNSIEKIESEAYNHISKKGIIYATKISNNRIVLSSLSNGSYIIDLLGNFILALNTNTGIPNDTHIHSFEDKTGNLWLAMDHGIAKIMLSMPFLLYDKYFGLKGAVMDVVEYDNKLFVATWQGLYYIDLFTNNFEEALNPVFTQVGDINYTIWKISVLEQNNKKFLLLATTQGLYIMDNKLSVKLLSKNNFSYYSVFQSKSRKDLLFVGRVDYLDVYKIDNNKISLLKSFKVEGSPHRILTINEDNNGILWFGAEYNGLYSIPLHSDSLEMFSHTKKLPFSDYYHIFLFNKYTFFSTVEGIFIAKEYKKDNTEFVPLFKKNMPKYLKNFYINNFLNTNDNTTWFQLSFKNEFKKYVGKVELDYNRLVLDFSSFKIFPSIEVIGSYSCSNNFIWLATDDGLFTFPKAKTSVVTSKINTNIRKIFLNNDSIINNNLLNKNESVVHKIKYTYNTITFQFSSSSFIDEKSNLFRYKLENFDKNWSEWGKEHIKEYTNLPPGKYRFLVESKDINDNVSQPAIFEFEILSPWYATYTAYSIYAIFLVLIVYFINYLSNRQLILSKQKLEVIVNERTNELEKEKQNIEFEKEKADKLLLNVLPVKVAEILKQEGYYSPEEYESATVIFTDFENFTKIASEETPDEIVEKLGRFFSLFDEICIRNKLEKIKTIGDAHMSVGGVPVVNKTHVFDAILAAIEMIEVVEKTKKRYDWGTQWNLRIGIHTGNIIAGIVGKNKFVYDVWGDTVNVASRLQEIGVPGMINISADVYEIIKPYFVTIARGKHFIKNKGEIDMYLVTRLKPEFSKNEEGTKPNYEFRKMYWQLK